ncbi:Transcriptional activator protein ExaE [Zhongshania aliphaticivorans]|uniref:Transcriptional activator protein ExaE n=1 Tax=Zhongshania aliphaticivorans TaxID=1470434 RepID=A0A5S9N6I5_9GAMM|nr:response regulator transcription factor [Zhongshania aliphaticivorans]CAA0080615.1 Transcriptional activator protein ExaE [Zhongshania aliphaticivorans]CAA0085515.1 Transcriptional activator protein ExaE [Zhongshania aliphaticivorans]
MKIIIADGHRLVGKSVSCLLRSMLPSIDVETANSGAEAMHLYAAHSPDALITELLLPDYSGLELCRRVRQRWRKANIIFLSGMDDVSMIKQALSVGANGFISKNCAPEELLSAIEETTSGNVYLEHNVAMQLAMGQLDTVDARLAEMTQREVEILILIARGESNQCVAKRLSISVKTVSNHISALKGKLEISSSLELLHFAVDSGLVRYGVRGSAGTASAFG